MRSRLIAVTLSLCFVLFGCSGKSNSGDANSASGDVANPSSSGSASGGGEQPVAVAQRALRKRSQNLNRS